MYIDFSKITRDAYGKIERPIMILKKPHEEIIGVLSNAFNLQMELKFSEISSATFSYPINDGDLRIPFYEEIVKDKLIEIQPYGVFIVDDYKEKTDGVKTYKDVSLQSREYELCRKRLVIGEGIYNLWNPAAQDDTIVSYILDASPGWQLGYVSPTLIGRYRVLGDTDSFVTDFVYGTVQKSFGCTAVFDSFNRTINLIDIDEVVPRLPVYLSYDNLVAEGVIEQLKESITTRLRVKGAEGVDITPVNPAGDFYIYNLDWYIENGDIPGGLAQKWRSWENLIFTKQPAYAAMVALHNTQLARQLTETAALAELNNQKATLENLRTVDLQMQASVSKNSSTWTDMADALQEIQEKLNVIDSQIQVKESLLADIATNLESINSDIMNINAELALSAYFTEGELETLQSYFKDDTLQDTTFAVFDVSVEDNGGYAEADMASVELNNITMVAVEETSDRFIGCIYSGLLSVSEAKVESASIVSGTVNVTGDAFVATFFTSPVKMGDFDYPSGTITMTGKCEPSRAWMNSLEQVEVPEYSGDESISHTVFSYEGSSSIQVTDVAVYLTQNASDYQKYTVSQELYNYAVDILAERAYPMYEFEIDSANFVYAPGYEAFRDVLQLGSACYLDIKPGVQLNPVLIEVHISPDSEEDFKLVFSNTFRRSGDVEKLSEIVRSNSSTATTFDSNKFAYGDNSNTTTWVKNLLLNGYDAASNQISAGKDNFVAIDAAGIKIDSVDGVDVIQMNNGMIALIDKRTNTVKMAMGHFFNPATNTDYVGIMADIIGGTLLAGQNLIIECPDPNGGVMQFKVDSSGVILNNGRFYIRNDKGAIGVDGKHGFFAGTKEMFVMTDSGYVIPVCIDDNGNLILDDVGFPKDTNVWIGIDGQVYIRGNIYAESGRFNGVVQATDFLDASGKSMLTDSGKISSEYLELMGLVIKNSKGETVLEITEDGIYFISSNDSGGDSASDYEDRIADLEDTVGGWQYRNGTYIDGGMIKAGTVMASSLQGGEVLLLDEDENDAGYITIEDASSSDYAIRLGSGGALSMVAENGNVYIDSMGNFIGVDGAGTGDVTTNTNIRSTSDGTYDLGLSWARWGDVYASNGTIQTSDLEKKTDFQYDLSVMDGFFDALKPLRYKFKDGHGRYHVGYISQDIEAALEKNALDSMDFAGFIKSEKPGADGYDYALRYSEFIALNTWQIQQMKARITELEAKLAALNN